MSAILWPTSGCCSPDYHGGCVCSPEERALRAYAAGGQLPPMTLDQREYCLREIDRVEGYRRSDVEPSNDADLARTTLDAWLDYCRDKGLLL